MERLYERTKDEIEIAVIRDRSCAKMGRHDRGRKERKWAQSEQGATVLKYSRYRPMHEKIWSEK